MTADRRWIDTVDVAKMVRGILRRRFPKTRFTVRSSRYAGGSSIHVDWTDGPTRRRVEEEIGHYQGASFDGMIDLKSYHDSELDGERVHFGNDFLNCQRSTSQTFIARVAEEAERKLGWPIPRTLDKARLCHIPAMNADADDIIYRLAENRAFYD
jgi:hypothetical protein